MKEKLDENFKIPGLVGEEERFKTFAQYIQENHEETSNELRKLSYANATLEHDLERKSKVLREELRGKLEKLEKEKGDSHEAVSAQLTRVDGEVRALLEGTREPPNRFLAVRRAEEGGLLRARPDHRKRRAERALSP